jgi:hypothetical protein
MLNEFSKTGEFILIDAAQRDAILKEVTYQNDGAVDPAQAKNIGKQSGADILVFGDIRMQPKTLDGRAGNRRQARRRKGRPYRPPYLRIHPGRVDCV